MEKLVVLFVIREQSEHFFGIWLHHGGPFADIDAIQKLPDALLPAVVACWINAAENRQKDQWEGTEINAQDSAQKRFLMKANL